VTTERRYLIPDDLTPVARTAVDDLVRAGLARAVLEPADTGGQWRIYATPAGAEVLGRMNDDPDNALEILAEALEDWAR